MTATQMAIKKETINNIVIGNTNFKIELLSTIKSTEICFPMFSHNFIYSLPRDGVFPRISMVTMTTFPGTSLIVKKKNLFE